MGVNALPHDHGDISQVLGTMPDYETFKNMADSFRLISDGTRLRILWLLCHAEECVCNIASAVDMSAPAVSHHLRILKQSGLITSRRKGKEIHYTIAETEEAQMIHRMIDELLHLKCCIEEGNKR